MDEIKMELLRIAAYSFPNNTRQSTTEIIRRAKEFEGYVMVKKADIKAIK